MNKFLIFVFAVLVFITGLVIGNQQVAKKEQRTQELESAEKITFAPTPNERPNVTDLGPFEDVVGQLPEDQFMNFIYDFEGLDVFHIESDNADLSITGPMSNGKLTISNNTLEFVIIDSIALMGNGCTITFKDGGRIIEPRDKITIDMTSCAIDYTTDVYIKTSDMVYTWVWKSN